MSENIKKLTEFFSHASDNTPKEEQELKAQLNPDEIELLDTIEHALAEFSRYVVEKTLAHIGDISIRKDPLADGSLFEAISVFGSFGAPVPLIHAVLRAMDIQFKSEDLIRAFTKYVSQKLIQNLGSEPSELSENEELQEKITEDIQEELAKLSEKFKN